MAFFDKLNDLARNITEKTNDAIETSKLSSQVTSARAAAGEELKKIGQFYYDQYAAGEAVDPAIGAFCQAAQAHFEAAGQAQGEIDRIRAEAEAAKAAAAPPVQPATAAVCPACGASNTPGTKFCGGCGAKLEPPAPGVLCPACGTDNAPSTKFCRQCGAKLEAAEPPRPRSCPACGAAVENGGRFCNSCGAKLEELPAGGPGAETSPPPQHSSSRRTE